MHGGEVYYRKRRLAEEDAWRRGEGEEKRRKKTEAKGEEVQIMKTSLN